MVLETFYQTVAQLSFTLLGLWFLVLQTKYQEWIGSPTDRRMVTSIAFSQILDLCASPNRKDFSVSPSG
jgi:hypothetical protein